jgi:hypothetical protein
MSPFFDPSKRSANDTDRSESSKVGSYTGGNTTMPISSQPHEALAQMNRRIDRLSLACQAMWELLREKADVNEDQLRDKILEVDLRDGATDGKMSPTIQECTHCKSKTNSRRPTCIICGVELPKKHQFEV